MVLRGSARVNFGANRSRVVRAMPGGLMEQLSNELIGGKKKKPIFLRQLSCVELNTLGSLCLKEDKAAIKITRAYYWTHAKDMASYFKDQFPRIKALIGIKDKEVNILNDPRRKQLKDDHALLCREEAPDEDRSVDVKKIRYLQEEAELATTKRMASALIIKVLQDEAESAVAKRIAAAKRIRGLQADFPGLKSFKDFVLSTLGIQWEIVKAKIEKLEAEKDALDRRSAAASQPGHTSEITYTEEFKKTLSLIKTARSIEELDKIETDWVYERDYYELLNALLDRERKLQNLPPLELQKSILEKNSGSNEKNMALYSEFMAGRITYIEFIRGE